MARKLVNVKFTDPETEVTSFGTVPEFVLEKWLAKGYEVATIEEVKAARSGASDSTAPTVPVEDLQHGLILDAPVDLPAGIDPAVTQEPDLHVESVVEDPAADPQNSDEALPVGDSTAGDDADSNPGSQPNRGRRGR